MGKRGPTRTQLRRLDPASLAAAAWTLLALRRVRRDLRADGLAGARVFPPPRLPRRGRAGVLAVLRRRPSTCLERALVLQRWEASHGAPSDVVIGMDGPGDRFSAHAWLESLPDGPVAAYRETLRIPAPAE